MARQRGFQHRGPRRRTSWGLGPGGSGVTAISGSSVGFLGSAIIPDSEGLTLARLRGRLSGVLTAATAAGDGFQGAVGVGIVTASAVATGIASVPTPLTDLGWDGWLYHSFFSAHAEQGPLTSAVASGFDFEVDSRAMRKWPDVEMSVVAMFEAVEIGTAALSVFFDSRVLVLLA